LLYSRFEKGKKARVYAGYTTRLLNSKSHSFTGVPVRFWRGAPLNCGTVQQYTLLYSLLCCLLCCLPMLFLAEAIKAK
jgi:hypothetical protein